METLGKKLILLVAFFSLVACGGEKKDSAQTVKSTKTESHPHTVDKKTYKLAKGSVQINDVKVNYDEGAKSINLSGQVEFSHIDNGAPESMKINLLGIVDVEGFAQLKSVEQGNSTVEVAAKATCLGLDGDCRSSFIDIYIKSGGVVYHHQVESIADDFGNNITQTAESSGDDHSNTDDVDGDDPDANKEYNDYADDQGIGGFIGDVDNDITTLFSDLKGSVPTAPSETTSSGPTDAEKALLAQLDKAKKEADEAKAVAQLAQSESKKAQDLAAKAKLEADKARKDADQAKAQVDKANQESQSIKSQLDKARKDLDLAKAEANKARTLLAQAEEARKKGEQAKAQQLAEQAKEAQAKATKAEAEAKRIQETAAKQQAELKLKKETAEKEQKAREQAAKAQAEKERLARVEAEAKAKADAEAKKQATAKAKAEAEAKAKAEAEAKAREKANGEGSGKSAPTVGSNVEINKLSQAIGQVNKGNLQNAMNFNEFVANKAGAQNGVKVVHLQRKRFYATNELMYVLDIINKMSYTLTPGFKTSVGDLSSQKGGKLGRHKSHQNGLDADITYYFKRKNFEGYFASAVAVNKVHPDWMYEQQWTMFKRIQQTGFLDRIFIHPVMKKKLCEHAIKLGEYKKGDDKSLAAQTLRRLSPESGHDDHYHLRLKCSKSQVRCRQLPDVSPAIGC